MQLFQENANWLVVHQIYRADLQELSVARRTGRGERAVPAYVCVCVCTYTRARRAGSDERKSKGRRKRGAFRYLITPCLPANRPIVRAARLIIRRKTGQYSRARRCFRRPVTSRRAQTNANAPRCIVEASSRRIVRRSNKKMEYHVRVGGARDATA